MHLHNEVLLSKGFRFLLLLNNIKKFFSMERFSFPHTGLKSIIIVSNNVTIVFHYLYRNITEYASLHKTNDDAI